MEIESEPGRGTCFRLRLPLTLAIIEGLVARVGREHYIVPTLSVLRLVQPRPEDLTRPFDHQEMLAFGDGHVPLLRLADLFEVPGETCGLDQGVVIVVQDEGCLLGLVADELLGQQSIVIKNLGASIQDTEGLAGGAIMSDGKVALILDVAGLARAAAEDGGRE